MTWVDRLHVRVEGTSGMCHGMWCASGGLRRNSEGTLKAEPRSHSVFKSHSKRKERSLEAEEEK